MSTVVIRMSILRHIPIRVPLILYLNSGLQLLTQVVVADVTTLRWRGAVSSLMFTPFLINAWVGSNISADVLEGAGWRWGCT